MNQIVQRYFHTPNAAKRTEEKPAVMKYIWLAVLLCFLAGIVGANLVDREQLNGFGVWNSYFMEKFKYAPIRPTDLFYYVLRQRLPVMGILLLFTFTGWGIAAGSVFLAWQSFAAGFLMAASVAVYGLKGILMMGCAFFPQYLIYIPLYIGIIYLSDFLKKRTGTWSSRGMLKGSRMRKAFLLFAVCMVLMTLYITGIFLESYINPFLFKKILKIF